MGIKEGLGGIRQTGRTLYGQSPGAPRFGARARLFQGLGRHHQRMSIGARISHDSQRLFACQTAAVTAHEEVRANRAHVDSPLRGFRTIKRCFSVSDTPDLMQRQRTPRDEASAVARSREDHEKEQRQGERELARFVEEGGTLLVEGSTSTIFPEYGITRGVTVESSDRLFARGSILRGLIKDKKSPLVYGYDGDQLPVYFNQDPVLNAGAGGIPSEFAGFFGGGQGQIPGVGQNITPMATPLRLSPWEADSTQPSGAQRPQVDEVAAFRQMARQFGVNLDDARPRVVMAFPANTNDLLLSGTLAGGQLLSNRAQLVDAPLGKGHVVMFAIRPFWRWQTQGTFFLGFNAILNWNDLDAGKPATQEPPVGEQRGR